MNKKFDDNTDIFLTTTEAAKLLHVSVATMKKYIYLGKIKSIKTPGGHHRINKRDLMEDLYQ